MAASRAVSVRLPLEQLQCVEGVSAVLRADRFEATTTWTRSRILTWLVWRGLASLTPADIRRGGWDARARALRIWLKEGAT